MNLSQEYILSTYQDYGPLGTKENIHLVRDKKDGKIYIKKEVDSSLSNIVNFRRTHNSNYFPKLIATIESEDKITIIEEYIDGVTLEEYMAGNPLPEEIAIKIAGEIAQALQQLHNANPCIIYRDLTASNVMINSAGDIKLIDFNISREFNENKSRDTELLGTADYAAPEQFGYFQTDHRTDIYAFGVLFNYLLTGKFPIDQLTDGTYLPVIKKCIELEPSKRYQSIGDLIYILSPSDNYNSKLPTTKNTDATQDSIDANTIPAPSSWIIPGFRSRKVWKIIVSIIVYLSIILFSFSLDFTATSGEPYPMWVIYFRRVVFFASQIFSVFVFFDYRNLGKYIKLFKKKKVFLRIIECTILWFIILFTFVTTSSIIEVLCGIE